MTHHENLPQGSVTGGEPPLPEDATELAMLVQDERQPKWRRDAAWEKLSNNFVKPMTNKIAGNDGGEFFSKASVVVWDLLYHQKKFEPSRGRFEAWLSTVLSNLYCDEGRQSKREGKLLSPLETEQGPLPLPAPEEDGLAQELDALLQRLRCILDQISQHSQLNSSKVDYYAVLLVQLRLVMAKCMCFKRDVLPHLSYPLSDFIAWALPWTEEEHRRSLRPGWSPLSDVWKAIAPLINRHVPAVSISDVCAALAGLTGKEPQITPAVWSQWVLRAKKLVRDLVSQEDWQELFASLLPDRPPRHR